MKGAVQSSWDKIQELGTAVVGEHIYRRFFELVPEAVNCFPKHVRIKYQVWDATDEEEGDDLLNSAALANLFAKVVNAIGCTVAGLRDSSKLVPLLTSLGMRHIGYSVNESFWPALGKAMNATLSELLGESFTPEVETAWNVVYGFMSQIMIEGLRKAIQAAKTFDGDGARSQSRLSATESHSEVDAHCEADSCGAFPRLASESSTLSGPEA